MHLTSMRPTFQMSLPHAREEVMRRIGEQLQRPNRTIKSLVFRQYVELHIPEGQVRFWSPHLSLSFESEESSTLVHGRFAPRIEVWTFIWVVYLVLAFSAFFAAVFECSFWMLGQTTWFGIAAVVALVGMAIVYLASQIGQALSADQMHALRSDWQSVVDEAFPADEAFPVDDAASSKP